MLLFSGNLRQTSPPSSRCSLQVAQRGSALIGSRVVDFPFRCQSGIGTCPDCRSGFADGQCEVSIPCARSSSCANYAGAPLPQPCKAVPLRGCCVWDDEGHVASPTARCMFEKYEVAGPGFLGNVPDTQSPRQGFFVAARSRMTRAAVTETFGWRG